MGQFLDKPNTEKDSHHGTFEDGTAYYGLSSMQGWRVHMEDAHVHAPSLPGIADTAFFSVLDGHGGNTVSTKGAPMMVKNFLESKVVKDAINNDEVTPEVLSEGYRQSLLALDEIVKDTHPDLKSGQDRSGSTVNSCFVTKTHFVVGNTGDSRTVIGDASAVKFASEDHKPNDDGERARITNAGGFVEMGRVCGNLAVSRALGDYEYKDRTDLSPEEQKITVNPEMTIVPRDDGDKYVVIACDGIWDVMKNRQSLAFVDFYHKRSYDAVEIAELLLDYCLKLGSKDNMSVIVLILPSAPKPTIKRDAQETDEALAARVADEAKSVSSLLAQMDD